jgi:hypothetical protein
MDFLLLGFAHADSAHPSGMPLVDTRLICGEKRIVMPSVAVAREAGGKVEAAGDGLAQMPGIHVRNTASKSG